MSWFRRNKARMQANAEAIARLERQRLMTERQRLLLRRSPGFRRNPQMNRAAAGAVATVRAQADLNRARALEALTGVPYSNRNRRMLGTISRGGWGLL
jgi:hypothetical protein